VEERTRASRARSRFFPFDYAQGQNDNWKSKSKHKNKQRQEQTTAKANTEILRFAQDDGGKQATAEATGAAIVSRFKDNESRCVPYSQVGSCAHVSCY
jgi:hypothetical protein